MRLLRALRLVVLRTHRARWVRTSSQHGTESGGLLVTLNWCVMRRCYLGEGNLVSTPPELLMFPAWPSYYYLVSYHSAGSHFGAAIVNWQGIAPMLNHDYSQHCGTRNDTRRKRGQIALTPSKLETRYWDKLLGNSIGSVWGFW